MVKNPYEFEDGAMNVFSLHVCFQYQSSLNEVQKYCRMLQGEHSAIISTFIKLPFVINIFVLPFYEWPLKTGFTVLRVYGYYKHVEAGNLLIQQSYLDLLCKSCFILLLAGILMCSQFG